MADNQLGGDTSLIVACTTITRGLYREIFGCFVPGAITVSFFVALPMLTYYVLTPADQFRHTVAMLGDLLNGADGSLGYVIGTLFVTFSYAIGSILYRRPLENVDAVASLRRWANTKNEEERKGLTVQFNKLTEKNETMSHSELASWIVGPEDKIPQRETELLLKYIESIADPWSPRSYLQFLIEFRLNMPPWISRGDRILRFCGEAIKYPYPYLRNYLDRRGFSGLLRFVGWTPKTFSSAADKDKLCSKNAINILKYRVRHYGTNDMAVEMDRNECHIRMLNSLWYSFRFIRLVAIVCSALVIGWIGHSELKGCVCDFISDFDGCSANMPSCSFSLRSLSLTSPTSAVSVVTSVDVREMSVSNVTGASVVVKDEKAAPAVNGDTIAENPSRVNRLRRVLVCLDGSARLWNRHRGRVWALFAFAALFLGLSFCRLNIEKTFHYVREREIVFILESVEILDRENPKLFEDIVTAVRKAMKRGR